LLLSRRLGLLPACRLGLLLLAGKLGLLLLARPLLLLLPACCLSLLLLAGPLGLLLLLAGQFSLLLLAGQFGLLLLAGELSLLLGRLLLPEFLPGGRSRPARERPRGTLRHQCQGPGGQQRCSQNQHKGAGFHEGEFHGNASLITIGPSSRYLVIAEFIVGLHRFL
jgi:hypothetical protein